MHLLLDSRSRLLYINEQDFSISELTPKYDDVAQMVSIFKGSAAIIRPTTFSAFEVGEELTVYRKYEDFKAFLEGVFAPVMASPAILTARTISTASINNQVIIGAPAVITEIKAINESLEAHAYLKIYNLSTEPDPTIDVPVLTLRIRKDDEITERLAEPLVMDQGIGILITRGLADDDQTAIAANQVLLSIKYQ